VGPIAVNFHGVEMFQPPANWKERFKSYLLKGATKWNLMQADFCISYGGEITQIHEKIGIERKRIIEIPSGIDREWIAESKQQQDVPTFLFIGRYERRKGIEELTEVIKKDKSLQFHFIGNIPHTKRIKRDNVIYWGEIKDKEELKKRIDACDVIVAPSFSEGMPNVLLEAMGRGLVPIATRVGAVPVLISQEEGFLIGPGNTNELSESLALVRELPGGERQAFLWEKIILQTEKAFQFMLENE
jgi:glycosyltransferase involved in cell wall biosynthesis